MKRYIGSKVVGEVGRRVVLGYVVVFCRFIGSMSILFLG